MKPLFKKHISNLQTALDKNLSELQIKGLILHAGETQYHFGDDMSMPFKASSHFRHWCPLEGEGHVLILRTGKKPLLLAYLPDDFWHYIVTIDQSDYWVDSFDIKIMKKKSEIWQFIQSEYADFHLYSPPCKSTQTLKLKNISKQLLARMNWHRSFKSAYEVNCLELATEMASKGHLKAKETFFAGGSELDIQYAYLNAMRLQESGLPYSSIIGLDKNASILHYHQKNDQHKHANLFLIDAGAQINGYASDISRTYITDKIHPVFSHLLTHMKQLQQKIVDQALPGTAYPKLHQMSHHEIANMLLETNIIFNLSCEEIVEKGLSKDFYPHGLGHNLGIQVHDVGGFQKNAQGDMLDMDKMYPTLRAGRTLEKDMYLTIEPGVYFIDSLLDKRKADSPNAKYYNWKLIDELRDLGGIRIEDNILITEDGNRNITREYLD